MDNGKWTMRTVEDAGPYKGCGEADRLRCPAVSLAINRLRHLPTAAHAYALLFPPLAAQGNAAVEDAGPYIGKEKRMKQKRKCRHCAWELVNDEQVLQSWLVERLGAEYHYNWSVRDAMGREEPRVAHPVQYASWLEQGPCRGCPCEGLCDRVCALRARWWDARMDRLKKRLGVY